jgi:ELWxxDGT repeat protein
MNVSTRRHDMKYSGLRSRGRSIVATLAASAMLAGILIGVGQSPAAAVTPPVAVDDAYTTTAGTALVQGAPGVLANDTDDVGPLTASGASDPPYGTVALSADGSFTYTPDANFVGNDTFTYTVSDGVDGSDVGLVTITVSPNTAEMIKDTNPAGSCSCGRFVDIGGGNAIYVSTSATAGVGGLWRTDGTAAGTVLVKSLTIPNIGFIPQLPPVAAGVGKWVFPVNDTAGGTGIELWVTDGTTAGTILLKDINPGIGDSLPMQMTSLGSLALFEATDPTNGTELWATDGTPTGTVLVKDINPLAASSSPNCGSVSLCNGFTVMGSFIYFAANDGTNGIELWRSDGTTANTLMVANINTAVGAGSSPQEFGVLGSTLLFRADGGTALGGPELWKSDGTPGGTTSLVLDIRSGTTGSSPSNLFPFGGLMLFSATGSTAQGAELWKSDGTPGGTVLLKEIRPGSSTTANITNFALVNGAAVFTANDGGAAFPGPGVGTGIEYWKTDGTTGGTVVIKDINPGTASSTPNTAVQFGSVAYFGANDGSHGALELFKTDLTSAGTVLVKDIFPGPTTGAVGNLKAVIGTLLFTASSDAVTASEPWRLTPANTPPVAVNDAYSTNEDTPLTVNAPGLIANDTDANSNVLHDTVKVSDPANGSVTVNGDGSFTYTPNANFNGSDSFTYKVTDGMDDSNVATVNITVTSVTEGPVAVDDNYSTNQNTSLTVAAPGVLGNDSDGDGDPLTAGSASIPANGAVAFNADGSFTYTPNNNFTGTDSFTYVVSSLGGTDTGQVNITITAPTISASPGTVTAGSPVTATWSGIAAPTGADWVGLYGSSGAADPALLAWSYTNGAAAGSLPLTVPAGSTPGATYELRLFSNNTYTRLATSAPFTVAASATTIAASPASVPAGGAVTATWSGIAAPTGTDWVGLYDSAAAPDAGLLAWSYTGGAAAGNLNLTVPLGSPAGATYELRLFSANTYSRLATSAPFAVTASSPAVSASPDPVTAGTPVTATWSGIPAPSATDWVGLYAASGDADTAIVAWTYTDGNAAGSLPVTVPANAPAGATYELRLFSNNSYSRLATSAPFSVTAASPQTATVTSSVSTVAAGNPLTANWSGITSPSATDWIGLYASSTDPDSAIVGEPFDGGVTSAWAYTGGSSAGSLVLTVPASAAPGTTYELRLFSNNSYTRLDTSTPFSVT